MRTWLRDHGLLLANLALFVIFIGGMALSGVRVWDSRDKPGVPWPVKRGGWVLNLYEHSLSALFFLLFFASWTLHAVGGAQAYSEEQLAHGGQPVSVWEYLTTSQFWFESFQNWQSEFLAVACIVGFSVYLRECGSPESKPVAEPSFGTGA